MGAGVHESVRAYMHTCVPATCITCSCTRVTGIHVCICTCIPKAAASGLLPATSCAIGLREKYQQNNRTWICHAFVALSIKFSSACLSQPNCRLIFLHARRPGHLPDLLRPCLFRGPARSVPRRARPGVRVARGPRLAASVAVAGPNRCGEPIWDAAACVQARGDTAARGDGDIAGQ